MEQRSLQLDGQVAIVTGGGKGIGKATASILAHHGARITVADCDLPAAEKTAAEVTKETSQPALAIQTDVSRASSVTEMVSGTLAEFSRIDILVNNAGIGGHALPISEVSEEEWEQVLNVNLKSVFLCCRAVIPHMRKRKSGKIRERGIHRRQGGQPAYDSLLGIEGRRHLPDQGAGQGSGGRWNPGKLRCARVIGTTILDTLTDEQVAYMTERIPMKRVENRKRWAPSFTS